MDYSAALPKPNDFEGFPPSLAAPSLTRRCRDGMASRKNKQRMREGPLQSIDKIKTSLGLLQVSNKARPSQHATVRRAVINCFRDAACVKTTTAKRNPGPKPVAPRPLFHTPV